MLFSFTSHPIKYLLERHFALFGGVQKIVAVYVENDDSIKAVLKTSNSVESLNIAEFSQSIQDFRRDTATTNWFEESELPFRVRQSGIFQKDLFQELDKTILLLRIKSQVDDLYDLLFVYFDKNLTNIGLSNKSNLRLTAELKPVLAKMLFQSVNSVISDAYLNRAILHQQFNPGTKAIIDAYQSLQVEYQQLNTNFISTFENIVKSLFNKYLDVYKLTFTLSEKAISKLLNFKGDFSQMEEIVRNTCDYISTLYGQSLPNNFTIEEYYIRIETINTIDDLQNFDKYTKTIQLLDNLDMAVKLVMEKDQNPTGLLVGQAMPKTITAPAITDLLKNHKSKILTLFDRYPDRWLGLRSFFKPIQNIIAQRKSQHYFGA
ncbi:MAG: hypothetical protein JXR60_01070 [Bacteroidales bacterium]|nr:hypothetical protein [Bacteroidales bacterium]